MCAWDDPARSGRYHRQVRQREKNSTTHTSQHTRIAPVKEAPVFAPQIYLSPSGRFSRHLAVPPLPSFPLPSFPALLVRAFPDRDYCFGVSSCLNLAHDRA